jgi:hypothetical protein
VFCSRYGFTEVDDALLEFSEEPRYAIEFGTLVIRQTPYVCVISILVPLSFFVPLSLTNYIGH